MAQFLGLFCAAQELDFNDPCVSLSAPDILYSVVQAGEVDWW